MRDGPQPTPTPTRTPSPHNPPPSPSPPSPSPHHPSPHHPSPHHPSPHHPSPHNPALSQTASSSQSTRGGQYYPDGRGKANDFQSPPAIQSAWPASFADGGGLSVNRDTLRQVSNAMKQDIAEIQAVWSDLQQNGLVAEADLGEWDAPSGLASATGNAFAGITHFVDDLIRAHHAVSDRIATSANVYADAETNNIALSHRVSI
jgi:hypothetical protein